MSAGERRVLQRREGTVNLGAEALVAPRHGWVGNAAHDTPLSGLGCPKPVPHGKFAPTLSRAARPRHDGSSGCHGRHGSVGGSPSQGWLMPVAKHFWT